MDVHSPGGVTLAQSYGELFQHRMKNAGEQAELNHLLMEAIKAHEVCVYTHARMRVCERARARAHTHTHTTQVKRVVDLLNQGASANFKQEVPDAQLRTPRKDGPGPGTSSLASPTKADAGKGGVANTGLHLWTPLIRACRWSLVS